jgi:hypothetical protein
MRDSHLIEGGDAEQVESGRKHSLGRAQSANLLDRIGSSESATRQGS